MIVQTLITEGCLLICMADIYIGIKKLKPLGGFLIATSLLAGLFWSAEIFVTLSEDPLMGHLAYGSTLTFLYLIAGFILIRATEKSLRGALDRAVHITWPEALLNFLLCGFTLHVCWSDIITYLGQLETRDVVDGLKILFS